MGIDINRLKSKVSNHDSHGNHGVKIEDEDEVLFTASRKTENHFLNKAATEKQEWLAYKNQGMLKARGRKSLGTAPDKLLSLSFDPMEAKVMLAEKFEAELQYHEACRAGLVLNPKTMEPRSYSSQAHTLVMAAYDRCINDLLRYGYSRVLEKEEENIHELPPVSINLMLSPEDMDDDITQAIQDFHGDTLEGVVTKEIRESVSKFKVPLRSFGNSSKEDQEDDE